MASKDVVPFRFPPGTSGNPHGARAYARRRQAVREISADCLKRISIILFEQGAGELDRLGEDASITVVEKLFISVVKRALDRGDAQALTLLLDRFLGKPSAAATVTGSAESMCETFNIQLITDRELLCRSSKLNRIVSTDPLLPEDVRLAYTTIAAFEESRLESTML